MKTSTRRPKSITGAVTTAQHYRELRPGIEGFRLVSATVTVTLLDDPRRARFEYECHLETSGELPAVSLRSSSASSCSSSSSFVASIMPSIS